MKFANALIIFVFYLSLTACLPSLVEDPKYAAVEANVLESPDPKSITGMWYHYNNCRDGKSVVSTMLIRSDGTGFTRVRLRGFDSDFGTTDNNYPLTWRYDGSGWWTSSQTSAGGHPNYEVRFRTDGKVLLHISSHGGIASRQVYVRADDANAVAAEQLAR